MQPWSKVSKMPAKGIKKMQDELLEIKIREMAARHPYYRNLFREKGLNANAFSAADIARLPLTTKADILGPPNDRFYPKNFVLEMPPVEGNVQKGGFKLFGKKEKEPDAQEYKLMNLYYSAGRTGKPVPIVYTAYDMENLKEVALRAYDIWGLTRNDTMVNAFSFIPNISFWQMYYGGLEIGSTMLQTGGGRVLGTEKILRALNNMKAKVLATSPGYAQFILQTSGHFGLNLTALERIIVGNDYAPISQADRLKKLMAGVMTKDTIVQRVYFVSEAKSGWAECEPDQGYHINPDHVLVEVIDPQSGEVKGEGEPGEVVITNLDARGTVLMRFCTGDITTGGLTTAPCIKCGRTVPRILGDIEKKELYYEMRGENGPVKLNGNALRRYMIEKPEVLQWYAELIKFGGKDGIKVVVSAAKEIEDKKAFEDIFAKDVSVQFNLPVIAKTSSLSAIINKAGMERNVTEQRIFDLR